VAIRNKDKQSDSTNEANSNNETTTKYRQESSGECIVEYKCEPKKLKSILKAGWNFISTSSGKSWNDIKGTCQLVQEAIYRFDPTKGQDAWQKITPTENLHPFAGYLVYVEKGCYLTDTVYSASGTLSLTIKKGYNLVSVEASKAFTIIKNDCVLKNNTLAQYTGSQSEPYKFLNINQIINPLIGYFGYFENDCTLKFEISGTSGSTTPTLPTIPSL